MHSTCLLIIDAIPKQIERKSYVALTKQLYARKNNLLCEVFVFVLLFHLRFVVVVECVFGDVFLVDDEDEGVDDENE